MKKENLQVKQKEKVGVNKKQEVPKMFKIVCEELAKSVKELNEMGGNENENN